jgi:ATP-dependent protease ClpP protease subunit
MAIYDAIRAYPAKATILAYAHARSMSSIILQAANKRVLMPHCVFMFHMGTYADFGTQKEVESNLEFFKRHNTTMVDIYAMRMKERGLLSAHTLQYIKRWIRERMDKKENVWLTAKQAVDYGLADEIFDYNWQNLTSYDAQQDLR